MKVVFNVTHTAPFRQLVADMQTEHENYYARCGAWWGLGYSKVGDTHKWVASSGNMITIQLSPSEPLKVIYEGTRGGMRGEWRAAIKAGTNSRPTLYETSTPSLKWDEFMVDAVRNGTAQWEDALTYLAYYYRRYGEVMDAPRFEWLATAITAKNERQLCAQYTSLQVKAVRKLWAEAAAV